MNYIQKITLFMLMCCQVIQLHAQENPVTIKGVVMDLESYQPLAGATISIPGHQIGTTSNEKGEFVIELPKGQSSDVLIRATLLGYNALDHVVTDEDKNNNFISFALKNEDAVIEEVVVRRSRDKAGELALLAYRKNTNLMVEAIGAQELSRKGVSDAQSALVKMTGVSRQQGAKNVFVRGLGDRYNSTTLNGLPLPSEDPIYKNISLDFFSSDIIESIHVNKTYNAQINGDVAGANIDIHTKQGNGNHFEIGLSQGFNSQTIGQNDFQRIAGTNWIGTLPAGSKPQITNLKQYDFKNSWNPSTQNYLMNSGFKVLGSRRFMVGNNPLNLFVSANMDSKFRFAEGKIQNANTEGVRYLDKDFKKYQYDVSQSGLLNLRYGWGQQSISFNSLYIHDQKQDFSDYFGKGKNEEEGDREFTRRQQVNDNHLFVNQLHSSLIFDDRWSAELGLGVNYVIGNEPDRRINNFLERNGIMNMSTNSAGENERFYSDIRELGIVSKAIISYKLANSDGFDRKIDFGYNGNIINRDYNSTIFNHRLIGNIPSNIDVNNVDGLLGKETIGTVFELQTGRGSGANALDEFYYKGTKDIHSALIGATYQFNDRFTAILGLRFDKLKQQVDYSTNLGSSDSYGPSLIDTSFIMPSLNLKYALSDKMVLRASGSQTYIMPQFIEVAKMVYNGPTFSLEGNSNLKPSKVYNVDLKWELYPKSSELIAVGVFYKMNNDPIARVRANSGGELMTFRNIGSNANVMGAELELRKDLFAVSSATADQALSAGFNVSYLFSNQKLEDPLARYTQTEDKLEGASPLLLNADLTYKANFSGVEIMPSIIFNYFSDRIYTLGTSNFENIVEKGIPTLDFVLNGKVKEKFGFSIKAENLLNPESKLSRGFINQAPKVLIENYKRGVDVSLGISYKF